jgi:hypothetical protein
MSKQAREFSTDLARRQSGALDRQQQAAAHDVAIRTTEPAKEGHHSLSVAKRQLRLEHEACVPTGGGGLEALVLLVSKLKEQQQRVGEHHERMFAYEARTP